MVKRKGESYLGGHTVITLHPSTVEAGLIEQAAEHKRQARNDQQKFDELRARQIDDANLKEHQSYSPTRRARQNAEAYFRDQLYQIERRLLTNPHPRIKRSLLSQQLELLEKLLGTIHTNASTERKITQRIYHVQRTLEILSRACPQ